MAAKKKKKRATKKKTPDGIRKLLDSGKKVITVWLIFCGTVWVSLSYVLALLGKETLEGLSERIVIVILGAFATYATTSVIEHISESKRGNINVVSCDTDEITEEEIEETKETGQSASEISELDESTTPI